MKCTMVIWTTTIVAAGACSGSSESGNDVTADPPVAQTPVNTEFDDISEYRLSMDRIDQLHKAQLAIGIAVDRMSVAEREAINSGASGSSLDSLVANIERNKPYNDAIRSAGLSAREYGTIMLAMMQASMAAAVLRTRPNDNPDSLAVAMKVNPENVRFLQANQEEINRRQAAITAEMKRLGIEE